jgi:hypothetical protein
MIFEAVAAVNFHKSKKYAQVTKDRAVFVTWARAAL